MKKNTREILRDYGITVLSAIAIAFFLRTYVIEAYRIPNTAMKPALIAGDTLFVEKWKFNFFPNPLPKRGDVVVYSLNPQAGIKPLDSIKRVIGLPGDTVALEKGHLILNGKNLFAPEKEGPDGVKLAPYTSLEKTPEGKLFAVSIQPPLMPNLPPRRVPEGSVFVMGDSRTQTDNTLRLNWGMVPLTALKGNALWIWLSIQKSETGDSLSLIPQLRFNRMFRRIL